MTIRQLLLFALVAFAFGVLAGWVFMSGMLRLMTPDAVPIILI